MSECGKVVLNNNIVRYTAGRESQGVVRLLLYIYIYSSNFGVRKRKCPAGVVAGFILGGISVAALGNLHPHLILSTWLHPEVSAGGVSICSRSSKDDPLGNHLAWDYLARISCGSGLIEHLYSGSIVLLCTLMLFWCAFHGC